jgi:YhcH/YjgK/YiaL family protein
MILDAVAQARRYSSLHPSFSLALSMVKNGSVARMPPGRHEIAGTSLYLSIGSERRKPPAQCLLEAHRRYIDIHVPMRGSDLIGWKPLAECVKLHRLYSDENDVALFSDEPAAWLKLEPGTIAIFFPEDAHAPLAGEGSVLKAVFKVLIDG